MAIIPLGADGITPAWAGKRHRLTHLPNTPGDHPRVGGEKYCIISCSLCQWGSPPRGRGKVQNALFFRSFIRITPAWAGKSPPCAVARCSVCGSPPRGRGKAPPCRVRPVGRGITPAWAGKRQLQHVRHPQPRDHPRVGGEKRPSSLGRRVLRGSPPRGRGKDRDVVLTTVHIRITPAWAGKSRKILAQSVHGGDHPRVGGEKTKKIP